MSKTPPVVPSHERRKARATAVAREVPAAIQWHEGMLLAPQHFQWLSQRHESLLQYHASVISPFHWGVRHFELDPVTLVDGLLRVIELEAVLPDGLVVAYSAGSGPELSADVTSRIEEMRHRPVMVHLAIASRGRGLAITERYTSEDGGPVPDENTGEGELSVPVLKPKLHLLVGEPPPQKFVSFPLVELAYQNEVFARTRFEPPALRLAPGSAVHQICEAIATHLREKAAFLADQVREPSPAAGLPQIAETREMIHGLVGELPAFEALVRTGTAHPFALYLALCGIVGHVAGLGRSLVPPVLEPYDHNDLVATFTQAQTFIRRTVSEGVHESYTAYPFVREGDEFKLPFDPEWADRQLMIGVRGAAEAGAEDVSSWVSGSLIGSRSKIMSLRDRRVMGVRRNRVDGDVGLAPPHGVSLYSLVTDREFVVPGEDLVVVNPSPGTKQAADWVVLFVKNPTEAR